MDSDKLEFNFPGQKNDFLNFYLQKSSFPFKFTINGEPTTRTINVFLHESSITKPIHCSHAKMNIYVSLEPYETENKITSQFLKQFDLAIISDSTVTGDNIIKLPSHLPWLYNQVMIEKHKHVVQFQPPPENLPKPSTDRILLITSNKTYYKSHRTRLELLEKIKRSTLNHRIDYFGFGFKTFTSKIDLLPQYRHAVVLENSNQPEFISEKLIDSIISGHNILYWGSAKAKEYTKYQYIQNFTEDFTTDINRFEAQCVSSRLPTIDEMRNQGSISAFQEANIINKIPGLVKYRVQKKKSDIIFPNYRYQSSGLRKVAKMIKGILK